MKNFLNGIVISVLLGAAIYLIADGVSRNETVECIKWQKQAKEYPAFYLAQWQSDQCKAHGISVNAPIKTWEK